LLFNIVADECVNFNIIRKLRDNGFEVYSILESNSGSSDEKVIAIAKEKKAILLTEDSDFGEWVFAHKIKDISVVFLRYSSSDLAFFSQTIINIFSRKEALYGKFIVLTHKKIRIREI